MSGREGAGRVKNRAPAAVQVRPPSTVHHLVKTALTCTSLRSPLNNCFAKPPTSKRPSFPNRSSVSRILRSFTSTVVASGKNSRRSFGGRGRTYALPLTLLLLTDTDSDSRLQISAWTKYANWEASQNEFPRFVSSFSPFLVSLPDPLLTLHSSRSVFERALDVEPGSIKLWLAYSEMVRFPFPLFSSNRVNRRRLLQELKARNISHARNLFDRAVTLLPRIDQIWYKYVFLEELLGNVAGARQVFERWMAWEPDEKAWSAYIKMEVRYNEMDRASKLYERMINCHPEPKHFVKWAKFEEERGNVGAWSPPFSSAVTLTKTSSRRSRSRDLPDGLRVLRPR
jgi:hypothetical protein